MIIPVFSIPKMRSKISEKQTQLRLRLLATSAARPSRSAPTLSGTQRKFIYSGELLPDWVTSNLEKYRFLSDINIKTIDLVDVRISSAKIHPTWWKNTFGYIYPPKDIPISLSLFGDLENFSVTNPKFVGIPESWETELTKIELHQNNLVFDLMYSTYGQSEHVEGTCFIDAIDTRSAGFDRPYFKIVMQFEAIFTE